MATIRIWLAALLVAVAHVPGMAQENRYMVFFKDKDGTPFTTANPIQYLSERAIDRRLKAGVDITEQDLPVQSSYVQGVRATGANTFYTTRWMNGVLIQCDPSLLASVESLAYVDHVEFVAPFAKLQPGGRQSFSLRRKGNRAGVETEDQLKMIGVDQMLADGYAGRGVTFAVLDSGFPGVDTAPAFASILGEGRLNDGVSFDFVHNSSDVFQYDGHGTEVLSVIGAEIPDAFTGGAPEASFQLFITEDVPTEYRIEEYNWLFAAERADSAGVDVIHSSLGYYDFDDPGMNYTLAQMDGKTAVVSKAAQWAADRGIAVVVSAGNEGNIPNWKIVSAPADAADVLAIGAVDRNRQKSAVSSIGPTADNRIKPDLVALGVGVKVVRETGQISSVSGTSLAAPLVTSLVAGILQRYQELTSSQVISLLKHTS
jgi:subtilisin family serine protease